MDKSHHASQHGRIDRRQHTMAEVEDVSATGLGSLIQNAPHLGLDHRPGGEQHDGINIPLERFRLADPDPSVP